MARRGDPPEFRRRVVDLVEGMVAAPFETRREQPPQGHFGETFETSVVHLVAKRLLEDPQNLWKGIGDSDVDAVFGWHTPPMIQATQWAGRLFCAADGTIPIEVDSDVRR